MYIKGIIPIKQATPMGCFTASLRMVLKYYGMEVTNEEVEKVLLKDNYGGSYLTELAWFASKKGFKVECYTYNLSLFSPEDAELPPNILIEKLQKRYKEYKSEWHKTICSSAIRCLGAGTKYIIKRTSLEDMKSYLNKSIPLIVTLNFTALYNKQGDSIMAHDVVLTGIKENTVYYVDPLYGEEKTVDLDTFMFAMMQRRIVEASSYMIAIQKK